MADKKTILIIDDDADIRDLLKDFLEEKSFNILTAENGQRAIEISEGQPVNLVISDMLLPGVHGIDVVKIIKKKLAIPIIVISGVYKKGEITSFLESDYVDAYFLKPLNLDGLLSTIKSLLNG
jgi:DNA-binding response OmpR family regulator